jgi:D-lactate dehydrogenase
MAGDRGMLYPELTRSASGPEVAELGASGASALYSSNLTCEIALGQASGLTARSAIYLLEEASRG